ncbi:peptidoglycan-binding protein [Nonomuraea sp. NPDC050536]|uniref:peptidoglycan-binding protein n=1 Tax=Nonomuraea sp. NPDC050536 TaxID=3364366 RepID=UPI0037CA3EE6
MGEAALRRSARPRRTGRIIAIAGSGILAAAALATALITRGGVVRDTPTAGQLPPSTAQVARQTLRDTTDSNGQLGFGPTNTIVSRLSGILTRLPEVGGKVSRGRTLYSVDDEPVTLMYGSLPAYRDLRTGTEGPDVRQLERNLKALGYSGFTVDDQYTAQTASAVKKWQKTRGLDQSGSVELGRVVFARGAVRVDSLEAARGDAVTPNGKVLSVTGTTQAVTVELDPAEQRLARPGRTVTVKLPDDRSIQGRISTVTTVIEPGESQNDDPTTKVEVVIALHGERAQRAARNYALASVTVSFVAGERKNVLTVPVAALVALRGGGFGVETVRGSTTGYVPVRTGLFADGQVEISGDGITQGTTVGMPK